MRSLRALVLLAVVPLLAACGSHGDAFDAVGGQGDTGTLATARQFVVENDARQLAQVLQSQAMDGTSLPPTLTTTQARALGFNPSADTTNATISDTVTRYSVSGSSFRFCIVDPQGGFALYDSARGGVVSSSGTGSACV